MVRWLEAHLAAEACMVNQFNASLFWFLWKITLTLWQLRAMGMMNALTEKPQLGLGNASGLQWPSPTTYVEFILFKWIWTTSKGFAKVTPIFFDSENWGHNGFSLKRPYLLSILTDFQNIASMIFNLCTLAFYYFIAYRNLATDAAGARRGGNHTRDF
jgi:hypothetical protein